MDLTVTQVALIVNAVGVMLAAFGAFLAYRQIRINQAWNRRRAAHDILFDAYQGEFRQIRRQLERKISIYDKSETWHDVKGRLSEEDHQALDDILNFLENVCQGIKNNIVDEKIIYQAIGNITVSYHRWALPYIEKDRREISGTLWIELDPYVEKWQKDMRIRVGRLREPGHRPLA